MWLQPSLSCVYYLAWLAQSAVTHQPSHLGQGLIVSMPTPLSPGDRAGAHLAVGTTEHELLSQVQELVHLYQSALPRAEHQRPSGECNHAQSRKCSHLLAAMMMVACIAVYNAGDVQVQLLQVRL